MPSFHEMLPMPLYINNFMNKYSLKIIPWKMTQRNNVAHNDTIIEKLFFRYLRYHDMVCSGKIEPEKLPPTNDAAKHHGLRVHLQVIEWKMLDKSLNLPPIDWGWKETIHRNKKFLTPITTTKPIAPENILKVIRCKCKSKKRQCETNVCTCRKNGIKCMAACGGCRGENCSNKMVSIGKSISSGTFQSNPSQPPPATPPPPPHSCIIHQNS